MFLVVLFTFFCLLVNLIEQWRGQECLHYLPDPVSNRWCNPGHFVKERLCSPNLKQLAVSLHPYYLLREFSCVIVNTTYITHLATAVWACGIIYSTRLQNQQPNAFIIITKDFNYTSSSTAFTTLHCFYSDSLMGVFRTVSLSQCCQSLPWHTYKQKRERKRKSYRETSFLSPYC